MGLKNVRVLGEYTPNSTEADFTPVQGRPRTTKRRGSKDDGVDRSYSHEMGKLLGLVDKNKQLAVSVSSR